MPMITNAFGGWLNYPEYFFFWCYHGQNAVFNTMGYKNPAMDALIDKARFTTGPEYEAAVKGFIDMAFEEVPRVPIYQPLLNVAMQKNVTGYRYWFHRQLDYRQLGEGLDLGRQQRQDCHPESSEGPSSASDSGSLAALADLAASRDRWP